MGWVGNEEVDINWDVSSDSSPITVLSHRGELNKEKKENPNGLCPQIAGFEQPLEDKETCQIKPNVVDKTEKLSSFFTLF